MSHNAFTEGSFRRGKKTQIASNVDNADQSSNDQTGDVANEQKQSNVESTHAPENTYSNPRSSQFQGSNDYPRERRESHSRENRYSSGGRGKGRGSYSQSYACNRGRGKNYQNTEANRYRGRGRSRSHVRRGFHREKRSDNAPSIGARTVQQRRYEERRSPHFQTNNQYRYTSRNMPEYTNEGDEFSFLEDYDHRERYNSELNPYDADTGGSRNYYEHPEKPTRWHNEHPVNWEQRRPSQHSTADAEHYNQQWNMEARYTEHFAEREPLRPYQGRNDQGRFTQSPTLSLSSEQNRPLLPQKSNVNLSDKETANSETRPTRGIEISGFKSSTNLETILMYFESTRRSGGGDILEHQENKSAMTVSITFEDEEAIDRVLARTHVLERATIVVKEKKVSPPRLLDRQKILLKGIPDNFTSETLMLILESRTKVDCDPVVVYGEQPGTALLSYNQEIPNLDSVIASFGQKSLFGVTLTAERVTATDCVLVQKLPPGSSSDTVELYFENSRKSGGGDVSFVQLDESNNSALVYFDDWTVVDRVIGRSHQLSGVSLVVTAHYDFLGTAVSTQCPTPAIPKPFTYSIDPIVTEFVMTTEKSAFVTEMENAQTCITWPHEGDTSLIFLSPHISKVNESESKVWGKWKDTAEKKISDYLQKFTTELMPIERKIWVNVSEALQDVQLELIQMLQLPEKSALLFVGRSVHIAKAKEVVTELVREQKIKSERDEQMTKRTMKLSQTKLNRFLFCGIEEDVRDQCQEVKITTSPDTQEVCFEGIPGEISEAQVSIYVMLEALEYIEVTVHPNIYQFISQVIDNIHEMFGTQGYKVTCELSEKKVFLYGRSQVKIRNAESFLQDQIRSSTMTIKSDVTMELLLSQNGKDHMKLITERTHTSLDINKSHRVIDITGFKDSVDDALVKMGTFIEENAIHHKIISLSRGHLEFLIQFCGKELDTIRRKNKSNGLKLEHDFKGSNGDLILSGNEKGVKNALEGIRSLTANLVQRKHRVDKAGMPKLLRESKGRRVLKSVGQDCDCIIGESPNAVENSMRHTQLDNDCQIQSHYTSTHGRRFVVCKGDMTKEKVDAIVNAANQKLQHIGGIARAIVSAGGQIIQEESDAILREKGRELAVAEAVSTRAGSLPCRYVIHVAGPMWRRKQLNIPPASTQTTEEKLLHKAITSSLQEAQRKKLQSIAFPAISSGVYGFPTDLCAATIVKAAADFFDINVDSSLKEIRFVNIESPKCTAFQEALKRTFGSGVIDGPKMHSDSASPGRAKTPTSTASPTMFAKLSPGTVSTKEGIQVTLMKGSITDDKVDVILNTAGGDMNLSRGNLSKALLQEAGPALQQECFGQLIVGGKKIEVQPGTFIETGPGNLNCSRVYHVNCPPYRKGLSEKVLHTVLSTVFAKAHQGGFKSIAIPAIGTGNLGFPRDVTAKMMYQEVSEFSRQYPSTLLKEVHFWVYDKDLPTVQAFESEMQKLTLHAGYTTADSKTSLKERGRKLKASVNGSKGATPFSITDSSSANERSGLMKASANDSNGATHFPTAKSSANEVQFGSVSVKLHQGDLTKEMTDAIVNTVGKDLGLDGVVARTLIQKGGSVIRDECDQIKQDSSQVPDVVMTTAGSLPSKKIFHVYLGGPKCLKRRTQEVLKQAEKAKLHSIAFPALGTGNIGGDPEKCASDLLEAIEEYVGQEKPQHIQLIRLTIFQSNMVSVFEEAMKSKVLRSGRSTRLFSREKTPVRNLFSSEDSAFLEHTSTQVPEDITLQITSNKERNIKKAIKMIDDYVKEEYCCEELLFIDEVMGDLTIAKLRKIGKIAGQNEVTLKRASESKIRLEGVRVSVKNTKAEIQTYLTRLQAGEKRKTEDMLINKEVKWRYKSDQEIFDDYDDDVSALIERAYREKKPFVDVEFNDEQVRIDFQSMVAKDMSGKKNDKEVHRADLKSEEKFSFPKNWTRMSDKDPYVLVPLGTATPEYKNVAAIITRSMAVDSKLGYPFNPSSIVKIERVQNKKLYKMYVAFRDDMKTRLPNTPNIERVLYHGTSKGTCEQIDRGGFNRSYTFKPSNGTVYGKGTYFATHASSSVDYAAADSSGIKRMYMCKVMVGEFTVGTTEMFVPPTKRNSKDKYDSLVDDVNNPQIFVAFLDAQAYPEYLITFK